MTWRRCSATTRAVARRAGAGRCAADTDPDRWSALEYACHVRDVFRLYDERLHLMLDEDDPTFANWDQDATAVADHYDEQDPETVGSDLVGRGGDVEHVVRRRHRRAAWPHRQTQRRCPVHDRVLRAYLVHDPVHHLWDVRQDRR